jgi:hypothetical protein
MNSYTTGWTSTGNGAYTPTGANFTSQSVRFHSYSASSGTTGDLITPVIDFSPYANQPKSLIFWMINTSGSDKVDVYLSTDGGTNYGSSLGTFTTYAAWTPIRVYLGTTASNNVKIKFTATSDFGTTDIGIDEVRVVNAEVFYTSTTWTAPAGVCTASVECWGGGGGGGFARGANGAAGGGGGGGAYARSSLAVTPESGYAIVIGNGGNGGTAAGVVAGNGTASNFGSTIVVANGGNGGTGVATNSAGSAGIGGTAASSTGLVKWSGGTGSVGLNGTTGTIGGGGGGGGAGIATDGNTVTSSITGASQVTGGGGGGSGASGLAGNPGQFPGGGGGGGHRTGGNNRSGGAGASGLVYISYTIATLLPTPTITTTTLCAGSFVTVSGTSTAPNGTTITVYKSGTTSLGTTTVSGGAWSVTGLTLSNNDLITAKASNGGTCNTSLASNSVSVPPTYSATATATPATICSGNATSLNLSFGSVTPPTYTAPPAVSNPTTDEDFGNITITQGATTILNNTTVANTLVGTIGTATGTAGSYSNFTAFGPYTLRSGLSYNFSASTINTTYGNAIGIYIDYNRDGDFADAGEAVYVSASTTIGSHTETGSFTVPASVSFGYTRMRIVVNEGAVTGPTMSVTWGEYEEYLINLQPDVTAYSWSDGTSSVGSTNPLSQSPTTNTSYTCTATVNGCPIVSNTVSVNVTSVVAPTANVATSSQCGTAVPTVSVSGTAANMRWYNADAPGGTLVQTGGLTYTSTVSTTTDFYVSQIISGCESPTRTQLTVTVSSPDVITAYVGGSGTSGGSTTPPSDTLCIGVAENLYVLQTGSTNTYSYTWTCPTTGNGINTTTGDNISVTPTLANTFVYTVTAVDGSCTTTSSVTILAKTPLSALTYSSGSTVSYCNGVAITNNTPTITGVPTSYSVSPALPAGLTLNTTTGVISGTPSATAAAANYTITARNGGCTTNTILNITILTPISGLNYTTPVSYCRNLPITTNSPTVTGTPVSYSVSPALPAGLSLNTTTGEITGTPTAAVSAASNYTVTVSNGGCTTTRVVSIAIIDVPGTAITPTPSNGATGVCYAGATPVTSVSWAATASATSYDVYFGAGSLPVTLTANVTTNSYTTGTLLSNTTYYWRVVAKNACGDAVSASTWTFTTSSLPCYCAAAAGGTSFEHLGNITIGSVTLTNSGHVTYRDNPSVVFTGDTSTSVSYTVTNPGTWYSADALYIFVDWNQDGDLIDAGELVATNTGATGPYTGSFTVPSGATIGTTRIRFKFGDTGASTAMTNSPCQTGFTYGEVEDARFNVTAPTGCTGTPTGGTVTVTPSEGAPSSTYAVAATGYTAAINITYLWQSNTNGAGWVDIGTASSTYSSLTGLTAPAFGTIIQYRLLVTCTNSSQSAFSTTGTFTSGYCIPSGSNGSYWITNFTTTTGITNINNTSAAAPGGYANFTAQSCSQVQGSTINFSISTNSGTHNFYIWVDWNNDGDFTDAGESIVASTPQTASYSGSYTIPLTQAAGSFRMRVAQNWSTTALTSCGTSSNGEYEDYIFSVVALPPCTGTPSAGTVVYSGGTICANSGTATVTASGYSTTASGLTFQWLSSSDNFATDSSSVAGGSNPASLSTGTLSSTTSYLLRAFCSNTGIYSYSNKVTVTVNSPLITAIVPASRCDAGTLTVSATGSTGTTIRWYSALTAGTLLQTGTAGTGTDSYTTPSLPYTSNNTYYVEALNGTCTSTPRTAVTANVVPPTSNPTITPLPTISICRDSILTLTATGSTVSTSTLLYEGFEGTTFPPSTFNFNTNGDGDYLQSSSYSYEGASAANLYSETDLWFWIGFFGEAGNVNMVQSTPLDLSSYANAKLTFYHICATEDGFDFGNVQYNDGTGWQNFPASAYTGAATLADANGNSSITDQIAFDKASYPDWDATFVDDFFDYLDIGATGYDPGNSLSLWKRESIDLTPFMTNNFRVRFRYTFDDLIDYYGWLIDSVAITGTQAIKYAWSPNSGLYTDAAATISYDSLSTPNAATVYAKPTATTTYKSIAYTGSAPATCSGNTSVTVNVTQKPTATIDAARPYVCDATAQLSASSVIPPTTTFNWTKASGTGSASATGNPATVSGLAGSTVYDVTATNGVCVDIPLGTSTVVTPTTSSVIATSPSAGTSVCNYCVYQDGNTKSYYNSTDGRLIAAITDETSNAANLGETEICFKVEGSVPSVIDNFGNTQPFLQRVWTINPTAGSTATITLYFTVAELAALQAAANSGAYQFSGLGSLGITKYANGGTAFTPNYTPPASAGGVVVPAVFSSFGADYQAQFQVSNFSTFYMHPLLFPFGALPVELVSFTGWNAGAANQLQWITATELNSQKFVVEKRIDGGSFTYLSELPAAGNSNQLLTYGLSDANPVVGNNYYRLKIIDIDGSFTYSNIINIPVSDVVKNGFNRVYPNPTGDNLNVENSVNCFLQY